jgi:MYXO-CTERM domain-containing protein
MYRPLRGLSLGAALLALSCSSNGSSSVPSTTGVAPTAPLTTTAGVKGAAVSLGVASLSATPSGAPRMLRAVKQVAPPSRMSAEAAARFHLDRLSPVWFKGGAGADLELIGVHPLGGGGSIVRFRQRVDGVEIYRGELRVLVAKDGTLKTVSGTRYPRTTGNSFQLDAPKALSSVIGGKYKLALAATAITTKRQRGDYQSLTVPPRTDLMVEDARAKRVYVDVKGRLQAAWFLEMFSSRSLTGTVDASRFIVAADDGRTLAEHDLTASEAHEYRVFAEATGEKRPLDGPIEDFTPHPRGIPDRTQPGFITPNLVSIDGFNEHRDPWLDSATTVTTGNNVDVFTDRNGDNRATAPDLRADKTGPLAFDYTYNTGAGPLSSDVQAKAAIVHLFYTINWLHDWWYDSGFNEVAGNAQLSNYGRGGVENDRMQANAQDQAVTSTDPDCNGAPCRSNANMSTPADGGAPRMQMYLFTNNYSAIDLTPGGSVAADGFQFGAQQFDVAGTVALVNDNSTDTTNATPGTFTDGCQAIINDVAGKIALLDRGSCDFTVKGANAQAAGAIGVIIANHLPGGPASGGSAVPAITIPANGTDLVAATALKAALQAGPVTARLRRVVDTELDGDLDTGIVAHEWGHYFHHRLSECNTKQCGAMSEGWGDFVALHLLIRSNDNFDGTYAAGGLYSLRADANGAYYGVRRYPYSVNFAKNPLTFGHIAVNAVLPTDVPTAGVVPDNSEVHSAGEVWASMLWESYRALLGAHDYETARRRMGDYLVAGLLLAPPDGTMTEVRDAILAAIGESDPADMLLVAQAFARRGAGSCAVAPDTNSQDFNDVEENFDVGASLTAGAISFVDDGLSCDSDGHLDRGETATLRFELANSGLFAASGVHVNVTTETAGIEIQSATIATLGAGQTADVVVQVTASESMPLNTLAAFEVEVVSDDSCNAVSEVVFAHVGVDESAQSTAAETADAFTHPWQAAGQLSDLIWSRQILPDGTAVFHAINAPITSDTTFTTPVLVVGQEPFTVTLRHRYLFEAGPVEDNGPIVYFDGGVIELSVDNGATWRDITTAGAAPAYNGALITELPQFGYVSENPLAGSNAYSDSNPSLPNFDTETLSFGTALAGQNVRLRFRATADQGSALYGWDIDQVAFAGITNTPFTSIVADADATCAFTVNAGADQTVESGDLVTLAGAITGSTTAISWTLVSGPAVTLDGATTATATFTAPTVTEPTALVFKLTASDGSEELSDEVLVTVNPADVPGTPDAGVPDAGTPQPDAGGGGDDGDDDDGCGCRTTSPAAAGNLLLPLAAAVLALRRRRKNAR